MGCMLLVTKAKIQQKRPPDQRCNIVRQSSRLGVALRLVSLLNPARVPADIDPGPYASAI